MSHWSRTGQKTKFPRPSGPFSTEDRAKHIFVMIMHRVQNADWTSLAKDERAYVGVGPERKSGRAEGTRARWSLLYAVPRDHSVFTIVNLPSLALPTTGIKRTERRISERGRDMEVLRLPPVALKHEVDHNAPGGDEGHRWPEIQNPD